MSSELVLTGLGFGLLVAATAAAAWSELRQPSETWRVSTVRGVRLISWLTAGLLMVAGWALWAESHSLSARSLRLVVLAAVAAPTEGDATDHHWSRVFRRLPALLLTGLALSQIAALPLGHTRTGTALAAAPVVSVGLLVCGGLAARAAGEALGYIAAPRPGSGWRTPAVVYALLTALVGGTAFYVLVRYGSLWTSTTVVSAFAATWLVWSATWLGRHWSFRLYAGLACASGLLLAAIALIAG